jgi:hypothetical protein
MTFLHSMTFSVREDASRPGGDLIARAETQSLGRSRRIVPRLILAEERDEVADGLVLENRVAERKLRVDLVAVVPTDLPASHVSRLLEVGEHAVGGALADPRCPRDLCHRRMRMARDRQQNLGVVGDECPGSEPEWDDCTPLVHTPQLHARRPFEFLILATPVKAVGPTALGSTRSIPDGRPSPPSETCVGALS